MNWLPTALSTIVLLGCFWAFWATTQALARVLVAADRLERMRSTVSGHDARIESQHAQLNQVRGMVYALRRRDEPEPQAPTGPSGLSYDACENWRTAQLEGPTSRAATCECAYCTSMRDARAAVKRAMLPGTLPGFSK